MYFKVLLLCLSLPIRHLSALPFLLGKASKPYGEAKHRAAPNPESKARSQQRGAGTLSTRTRVVSRASANGVSLSPEPSQSAQTRVREASRPVGNLGASSQLGPMANGPTLPTWYINPSVSSKTPKRAFHPHVPKMGPQTTLSTRRGFFLQFARCTQH